MAFFSAMTAGGEGVMSLPSDYEFDSPDPIWRTGFWLWAMSGFGRLPTRREVEELEPDWVSDMVLAMQMYKYVQDESGYVALAEHYFAQAEKDDKQP